MLHFCLAIIFAAVIHSYANECEFNEENYGAGERMTDQCRIFECSADGSWTDAGENSDCDMCIFAGISLGEQLAYINTLDSPWVNSANATACSYSLVQKYTSGSSVEETYDPSYPAVFVSLKSCGDDASRLCSDFITTRVNPDLQITFFSDLPNKILVNNVSITLTEQPETLSLNGNKIPVIGFVAEDGTYFMVPDILILYGGRFSGIFATPNLQGELAGICGHFDGDDQNDFLLRDGTTVDRADIDAFVDSWLTKEQDKCESPVSDEEETSCIDSDEVARTCVSLLASVPNLHTFIGICTSVLCNDPENGQLIIQAAVKTPSLMFKLLTVV